MSRFGVGRVIFELKAPGIYWRESAWFVLLKKRGGSRLAVTGPLHFGQVLVEALVRLPHTSLCA